MGQPNFHRNEKWLPFVSIGFQTVGAIIEDIVLEVVVVRGATNGDLCQISVRRGLGLLENTKGGKKAFNVNGLTIGGLGLGVLAG